jgi:hypothetical protein
MLTTNTPSTIDPNFKMYIFRLESHEVNYCHPSSDKLKPRAVTGSNPVFCEENGETVSLGPYSPKYRFKF